MTKGVHYINPGQWPCHIGFCDDPKAFTREMKRLKLPDMNFMASDRAAATTHFLENKKNGTLAILITIFPFDKRKRSREQFAALVAHEALHVVQEMWRDFNKTRPFGDEADAYLLQMIVQEGLSYFWRSGRTRAVKP